MAKAFQEFGPGQCMKPVEVLRPGGRRDGGTGEVHLADAGCFVLPGGSRQRAHKENGRGTGLACQLAESHVNAQPGPRCCCCRVNGILVTDTYRNQPLGGILGLKDSQLAGVEGRFEVRDA